MFLQSSERNLVQLMAWPSTATCSLDTPTTDGLTEKRCRSPRPCTVVGLRRARGTAVGLRSRRIKSGCRRSPRWPLAGGLRKRIREVRGWKTKRMNGGTHLSYRSNHGDVLTQTLAAGQGCAWPLEDVRVRSGLMGGRCGGRES